MTIYEQLLSRLIEKNKLEEYDGVDLNFASHHLKNNTDPTIKHNMIPTLTTGCNVVVVLIGGENEKAKN